MAKKATKKNIKRTKKNERTIKVGLIISIIVFVAIIYKIFDMLILSKEHYDLSGEKYYQYFYGMKEEFSGDMNVVIMDEEIQIILENDEVKYLDSTPIYYKDTLGKSLLAKEMALIVPDVATYKLTKFTNVIEENDKINVKKLNGKENKEVNKGFIFDGNNLYFFLEETTIKVGDTEYKVSPLSYAIVNYRQNVEIYDYEKEEYTIIEEESLVQSDVLATSVASNYEINMSLDSLVTERSSQLILKNINNLQEYMK